MIDAVKVYDPAWEGSDVLEYKQFLIEYGYEKEEVDEMTDDELVEAVSKLQWGLACDAAADREAWREGD